MAILDELLGIGQGGSIDPLSGFSAVMYDIFGPRDIRQEQRPSAADIMQQRTYSPQPLTVAQGVNNWLAGKTGEATPYPSETGGRPYDELFKTAQPIQGFAAPSSVPQAPAVRPVQPQPSPQTVAVPNRPTGGPVNVNMPSLVPPASPMQTMQRAGPPSLVPQNIMPPGQSPSAGDYLSAFARGASGGRGIVGGLIETIAGPGKDQEMARGTYGALIKRGVDPNLARTIVSDRDMMRAVLPKLFSGGADARLTEAKIKQAERGNWAPVRFSSGKSGLMNRYTGEIVKTPELPGLSLSGAGGVDAGGVYEFKRQQYLAQHPGDFEGALKYAAGQSPMRSEEIYWRARTLAQRDAEARGLFGKEAQEYVDRATQEHLSRMRPAQPQAPAANQPAGQVKQPAKKYREGATATGPNGQKVIYRNGKWVPLQ